MEQGWRTVIVDTPGRLHFSDGCLFMDKEEKDEIPLPIPISQIKDLVVENSFCTMSVPLMSELSQNGVNTIICDERKNPVCNMVPMNGHSDAAGRLFDQMAWSSERKAAVWTQVVGNKLRNQRQVLLENRPEALKTFDGYLESMEWNDASNREGMAARTYFQALFGKGFVRHETGVDNHALNYGYTLLRSCATRTIARHGYNAAIGVHHCSRENPFNLACDIMEPFRPIADRIVISNAGFELDSEYKKELLKVLQMPVFLDGEEMMVTSAMDEYLLDVVGVLDGGLAKVREVSMHD